MKDLQFKSDWWLAAIFIEGERQVKKWGVQDRDPMEWLCYLTEEVGELAEAIAENRYRGGLVEDVEKEAIQVATLAAKIAEMYHALGAELLKGEA